MLAPATLFVHPYLSALLAFLDFLISPKVNLLGQEASTPTLEEQVVSTAASLLGPSAFSTPPNLSTNQRGVLVFDILTSVSQTPRSATLHVLIQVPTAIALHSSPCILVASTRGALCFHVTDRSLLDHLAVQIPLLCLWHRHWPSAFP